MTVLYLPFSFLVADWWRALLSLDRALTEDAPDFRVVERKYARVTRRLVARGAPSVAEAIAIDLLSSEPPRALAAGGARGDGHGDGALELLRRDLATLTRLARRDLVAEASAVGFDAPTITDIGVRSDHPVVRTMVAALLSGDVERLMGGYLGAVRELGGGPGALHPALTWDGARLSPVPVPDLPDWSGLFGLDSQLGRLASNTEALLAGAPAHDVLLYGARGSGKSTAVRGLLTRYAQRGLRLVEVRTAALGGLPELLELLRGKPQGFVVYVDDLSFEDGDPAYRPLKSLLEGGLAARPDNVVVYATSNRRHLLRERFADRPSPEDEDVSRWDTQHERLALSDRFGLVVTFPDATQRRYLELVHALAGKHAVESEVLDEAALRFADRGNGYSGRTARQFVDQLRQDR